MGFKKLTENEIIYAEYENLIGLAKRDEKSTQAKDLRDLSSSKSYGGITESQSGIFSREGKKIPIMIESIDQIESDSQGAIKKVARHSTLVVKNPSASEKLWNITLEMNDASEILQIAEIAPNNDWKIPLEEKEPLTQVPLLLREVISRQDYSKDINAKSDLLLDKNGVNTLFITLFAKNQTNSIFKNIEIVKEFPSSLVRILESKSNDGQINQEKNKIKWIMPEITINKIFTATIKIQINPKAVRTGILTANFQYFQERDMVGIKKFHASSKIAQFINVYEQDENPGYWDCSMDVVNRSEIYHTIKYAELLKQDGNEVISLIKGENEIVLNPYEEKCVLKTVLQDKKQPNLSKVLEILPQYTFQLYSNCSEVFEDEKLEFLDLSVQKTFSLSEIKSFEPSSFDGDLKIQNLSSIPLNNLLIHEIVPHDFSFGNLSEITLNLKDRSVSLEDYKKTNSYSSPQEEIAALEKQILATEEEIEKIENQQRELANTINTIDPEQLNSEIESLQKIEQAKAGDLQSVAANHKSVLAKIENAQKTLENTQTLLENEQKMLEDLEMKKKRLENITSLDADLNAKEALYTQTKTQKEQLDEELKNTDAVADPAKYTELSQKIETLSKQLQEANANVEALKQQKKEIQTADKSNETLDQIVKKIEGHSAKVNQIKNEVNEAEKNLQIITVESEMLGKNLNVLESEISNLQANINQKQSLIQKFASSQTLTNDSLLKINELDSKNNQYRFQKELVIKSIASNSDVTSLVDFIVNMYTKSTDLIDFEGFDAIKVDTPSESHLLIHISNIEKLLTLYGENDLISISYPIDAVRPKNDTIYNFPTQIYYLGHTGGIVRQYILPQDKSPELTILHMRKRITLGKIVENYHEANKFAITIMVKNPGKTSIDNIVILDSLPIEAEIFNAMKAFEEKPLNKELKQIIWQISHLGPFEEIEIAYLVDLHGKICDLNEFNLIFQ